MNMTSSMPDYGANENDVSAGATATPLAAAAVSIISDLDDSLQHSCTLPQVDDEMQSIDTTGEFYCAQCFEISVSVSIGPVAST